MTALDLTVRSPAARLQARFAGVLYLIIIVCGISAEFALRGPLIVPGADLESAARILASLDQFRLGLAADAIMMIADIALALTFYALLKPLGAGLALGTLVFRLAQAAIIGASLVLLAGVPGLLNTGHHELGLHLTRMHATGYDLGLIFFGINSLLMSALLLRSDTLPRVIPLLLAGASLVYLTGGFLRLLAPDLIPTFEVAYVLPFLAESTLCLWLLIAGRV